MFVKQVPMHLRDRLSSVTRKKNDDDVVFVKQVPIHPSDRLARATRKKNDDDVAFVKQVPMHPRDRLARARRKKNDDDVLFVKQAPMHPRDRLARATKNDDDVLFVKQVPTHLRDRQKRKSKKLTHQKNRMKNKELQIARDNVLALMAGKFSFSPEKLLNKTILLNVSRVNKEKIMDKVIENLPSTNDDFYIIHKRGTNSFSLRREDGK